MVFDEINVQRKENGLLPYIWDDSLLQLAKRTNQILKNDNRLYHPEIDEKIFNKYEEIFVNRYFKLTNNKKFKYESAEEWSSIKDYSFIGEIISLNGIQTPDSIISKDVVNRWMNSIGHRNWILVNNTLVNNISHSGFCSCSFDYKLYNNQKYIVATCNMYVLNINSDWVFLKP
jgi:hypothetical protein